MKRTFFIICGAIYIALISLSELIPGAFTFVNKYSTLTLAFITAIYAYTTYKMLQTSHSQNEQLQKQNEQLQKQHAQNIGIQMLDKRAAIFAQFNAREYGKIDTASARFLFRDRIISAILDLDTQKCLLEVMISESKALSGYYSGTQANLHSRYVYCIENASVLLTEEPAIKEFMGLFDQVLDLLKLETAKADKLKSFIESIVTASQYIFRLHYNTIVDMEADIRDTIAY
jgi:hypothetical protein